MTKLKVFKGNFDGLSYKMVATSSIPKAMKLLGTPKKSLFDKYSEVVNQEKFPEDCEIALNSPGTVFRKVIDYSTHQKPQWEPEATSL